MLNHDLFLAVCRAVTFVQTGLASAALCPCYIGTIVSLVEQARRTQAQCLPHFCDVPSECRRGIPNKHIRQNREHHVTFGIPPSVRYPLVKPRCRRIRGKPLARVPRHFASVVNHEYAAIRHCQVRLSIRLTTNSGGSNLADSSSISNFEPSRHR